MDRSTRKPSFLVSSRSNLGRKTSMVRPIPLCVVYAVHISKAHLARLRCSGAVTGIRKVGKAEVAFTWFGMDLEPPLYEYAMAEKSGEKTPRSQTGLAAFGAWGHFRIVDEISEHTSRLSKSGSCQPNECESAPNGLFDGRRYIARGSSRGKRSCRANVCYDSVYRDTNLGAQQRRMLCKDPAFTTESQPATRLVFDDHVLETRRSRDLELPSQ